MRTIGYLVAGLSLAVMGCGPMADMRDASDDHDAAPLDASADASPEASPEASPDVSPPLDAADDREDAALDARLDAPRDAPHDVGLPPDGPFTPEPHANPTPLMSRGGPVLEHPRIVTITYANEPNRDAIERFGMAMTTDPWWTPAVSEYGVGPVTLLENVRLTDNAPRSASLADVASYLASHVTDGTLPSNADGTTEGIVYMLYVPYGAQILLPEYGASCSSWHGVHTETVVGSSKLAYAISVDCGPGNGFDSVEYLEVAASHELMESVTDPYGDSDPAYEIGPDSNDPWSIFSELTDRCVGQYLRRSGYALARNWSNAAAARGEDPCAPPPDGSVYYGVTAPTTTLHGPAGTTLDVPITGWSDAPVVDFRVRVTWAAGFFPVYRLDASTLNNGLATMLHVTIPAGTASGTRAWLELQAGPNDGDVRNFPMMVTVD